MEDRARAAAELAARASYGRLVGMIAARTRDIAEAEDMLALAFEQALRRWPLDGVPGNPDAWLLTAARRNAGKAVRHGAVQQAATGHLAMLEEERLDRMAEGGGVPDARLQLMFVCAHPAIDVLARTPLMLTAVMGLSAETVAQAFLVAPATLAQRLTRAKARIARAGIAFALPEAEALPERLEAVLEAVYAAHALGAHGAGGPELLDEAVFLARLLVGLLPDATEARGLLALLLFVGARRGASRSADGAYVPLDAQDPAAWDHGLIDAAEAMLAEAAAQQRPGRFQIEAAIHSAHCWRRTGQPVPWAAVLGLHERLQALAPTLGGAIARASVLGEVSGAEAALTALDGISAPDTYLPWHATRAHWLQREGRTGEARTAYLRAAGLARDASVARWLHERARASGQA